MMTTVKKLEVLSASKHELPFDKMGGLISFREKEQEKLEIPTWGSFGRGRTYSQNDREDNPWAEKQFESERANDGLSTCASSKRNSSDRSPPPSEQGFPSDKEMSVNLRSVKEFVPEWVNSGYNSPEQCHSPPRLNEKQPQVPIFVEQVDQIKRQQKNVNTQERGYRAKRKTELCKSWMRTGECTYGNECAFAHGHEEQQKKTHVASKYKLTQCTGFHSAPFFCVYGARCQFAHSQRHFDQSSKPSYRQLLEENAYQMLQRLENVEDPDISAFNVAMPNLKRAPVFEKIYKEGRQNTRKNRR